MTSSDSPSLEPTPPSLRAYLREAIIPRNFIDVAVLALIIAWPISMYLNGLRELPRASFDVRLLYLMGDTQYFDALRSIGTGTFGEWAVLEHQGEGFLAFPMIPFLIPALFTRLMGPVGLLISVPVMLWMAIVCCRLMLRCMGLRATVAAVGAAIMCCVPWFDLVTVHGVSLLNIWVPRLGRPMGTVPQTLLALAILALLARSAGHRTRISTWCILSAAVLLTLQGDLHTGITLGLISGTAWIACLIGARRRGIAKRLLLAALAAAAIGVVVLVPFLIARLRESPDAAAHLGLMKLSRLHPFVDRSNIVPYTGLILAFTGALAAWAWFHDQRLGSDDDRALPIAKHWPWVIVLAYLALPISIVLLGQGAQLFHFRETIRIFASVASFSGGLRLVQWALYERPAFALSAVLQRHRGVLAGLGLLVPTAAVVVPPLVPDLREGPRLIDKVPAGWRDSFIDTTNHLLTPQFDDALVIGTFDWHVYPFWTALRGRHAYNSDVLTTCLPDTITDRRFVEFCRFLGMSRQQFDRQLDDFDQLFYHLGQGKYSATRAYSLYPIDQYRAEDQQAIRAAALDQAWNLVVPIPERERLLAMFDQTPVGDAALSGRLDVVVLRDTDIAQGLQPPPQTWKQTFSSPHFTVWRRR